MTRVAAIDCGTNSIRLLVADINVGAGNSTLVDVDRRMEIVRLGQGVDRTGRLAPEALDRTFAALRRYADRISELGAERVRMVATSATRDAANRAEFVAGVQHILGVPPEVVSGDEEAQLSYVGATRELGADMTPPFLVVDIGGGSTELVLGNGNLRSAISVDIGCVRLTERHFHDDPPTADQVVAARADIEAALDRVEQTVPLHEARTLVGLAGSVTTVGGIALDLPAYDPVAIHHSRVAAGDRTRDQRPAARARPRRSRSDPGDASGTGRCHRGRCAGAARHRRPRRSFRGRRQRARHPRRHRVELRRLS